MIPLRLGGMAAELQDYIAENSGLGYVVGENFTLQDAADIQDLEQMVASRSQVLLTMFDEGGTLIPSGRRTPAERTFRFAVKGAHAQEALDRAHELLSWLWNRKAFATAGFVVWVLRAPGLPQVPVRGASGSHVADFIVSMLAYNR